MRIVVADYSGHPFPVELSRCLAKRGHSVLHLHFAGFQTPKGDLIKHSDDPPTFDVDGIQLERPFEKQRFLRRRFQEVKIGQRIAARALLFNPNIVVGCNMPLDAQHVLRRACAKAGISFVFWLQDIYSEAILHYLRTRFGLPGQFIGLHYRRLEGQILRSSDAVIAISQKFVEPLRQWGVITGRITVIPNWAPLSDIHPVAKNNDWARRHAFDVKTIALYTGTLGLKHDPALLLDLAREGRKTGLHVVVASEGPAITWLEQEIHELGVDNLTLLPFQSMKSYARLLGSGDIMLAMIGAEAASFSVPSKILSYLAAGRPVVASISADNDAAVMLRTAAAGLVVAPGDANSFIAAALKLASDAAMRESLGRNARNFAENNFGIEAIADRFEAIFKTIA